MRILICGADGFIGSHVARLLSDRGHTVIRGVHTLRQPGDIAIDYRKDITAEAWRPRLTGIDAVVNAIGILREQRSGDFELIHHRAPAALFEACRDAGIHRVVQISALGTATTPYLTTKHAADDALRQLVETGVAVRPGLVFGANGASTRLFLALARLPLQAHPGGAGDVQPVHVDDVAAVVARLIEGATAPGSILELPGPQRLSYAEWMHIYRAGIGFRPAIVLSVPAWLMTAGAWFAGLLPGSPLSPDTWTMLRAGNIGDPSPAQALLGRSLVAPRDFIPPQDAARLRLQASSFWHRPLLQLALALVWLVSALLSATMFSVEESVALLAPFHLSASKAALALYGAIGLDLLMGILTLFRPGGRLWLAQVGIIAAYSGLVAWHFPVYMLHPFGPMLKNLAVLILVVQLWGKDQAN
jgi:uncharacterized protein YbjT (DUF2867 family)